MIHAASDGSHLVDRVESANVVTARELVDVPEVATEWWTVEVAADATTEQLHLRPDYTAGLVAC